MEEVEERLKEWRERLGEMAALLQGRDVQEGVVLALEERVEKLTDKLPLLQALANPGLKDRHWKEIEATISEMDKGTAAADSLHDIKVVDLLNAGLKEQTQRLGELSSVASKEHTLETTLQRMYSEWDNVTFEFVPYKKTTIYVLSQTDDIELILDSQLVRTQVMLTSPFVGHVLTEVKAWLNHLNHIKDFIHLWKKCQSSWVYLEAIFTSEDIAYQIPEETKSFRQVDKNWRQLNAQVVECPRVQEIHNFGQILTTMKSMLEIFEFVQKGFYRYLEKKRQAFPRFFFLSDDELLDLLSYSKNPEYVQKHITKLFGGIRKLRFDLKKQIIGFLGLNGEEIHLQKAISVAAAKGHVEKWLSYLEEGMRLTVKLLLREADLSFIEIENDGFFHWVFRWPPQVVQAILWARLTLQIQHNITERTIKDLCRIMDIRIRRLSQFLTEGNVDDEKRKCIESLITLQVEGLKNIVRVRQGGQSIVSELDREGVERVEDFAWQAHIRYYQDKESFMVRMLNSEIAYDFEYLGHFQRLVATPLTRKCHRILMTALKYGYGGLLEGPAATGKTECVKELARFVGRQCVVFNCSETLDSRVLVKLLKGMVATGAWLCLDEFNRISLEGLSAITTHILTIQQALLRGRSKVVLEHTDLTLNRNCALFVTLNPAYAGRVLLPDNLKSLFRPVKMVHPDYMNIAQVSLYSGGYAEAKSLAHLVQFMLGSAVELLSTERHYDFRLRAMRATLVDCHRLRQLNDGSSEMEMVEEAIFETNQPRLTLQDSLRFRSIMKDFFPKERTTVNRDSTMHDLLVDACHTLHLYPGKGFVEKTLEVYKSSRFRQGTILIGDTCSGKSSALKVLKLALGKLAEQKGANGEGLVSEVFNPKAVTNEQLFGYFESVSHDWLDGLFGRRYREFTLNTFDEELWLIFDGPVDATWIETLNSVLDDNKRLCLPNGEIIPLSSRMRVLFEVESLELASPATISRCSVVCFPQQIVTWESLFSSSSVYSLLPEAAGKLLQKAISPKWKGIVQKRFMKSLLRYLSLFNPEDVLLKRETLDVEILLVVLYWTAFDLGLKTANWPNTLFRPFWKQSEEVAGVFPLVKGGGVTWMSWKSLPSHSDWRDVLVERGHFVHTVESIKISTLIHKFVTADIPILMCGPTGSGKSKVIENYLLNLSPDKYFILRFVFSSHSTALQLQEALLSQLERKKKFGIYSGPEGRKVVVLLEAVDTPVKTVEGAVGVLELLRQLLDLGYWFDLRDGSHQVLQNLTFIATCNDLEKLCPRFCSHWHILRMEDYSEHSLRKGLSRLLLSKSEKLQSSKVESSVSKLLSFHHSLQRQFHMYHGTSVLFSLINFVVEHLSHEVVPISRHLLFTFYRHPFFAVKERKTCLDILGRHIPGDSNDLKSALTLIREKEQDTQTAFYSSDELQTLLQGKQKEYAEEVGYPSGVILSHYALQHVAALCNTLSRRDGHNILAGINGTGRKLMVGLAAFVVGAKLQVLETTFSFSLHDWKEKLKKVLLQAGVEREKVVLMIPESEISGETMDIVLEDVSVIVNRGQIPLGLFAPEEQGEIVEKIQATASANVIFQDAIQLSVFQYLSIFRDNLCSNLHIVLTISPGNYSWFQHYPSLRNHAQLHWFQDWSSDDLTDILRVFFNGFSLLTADNAKIFMSLCKEVHTICGDYAERSGKTEVTPATFLELLRLFKELAEKKFQQVSAHRARYKTGTDRLDAAASQVNDMQEELRRLQPQLMETSAETGRLMMKIEFETVEVENAREVVASNEAAANDAATKAQTIKLECEHDLAEAIPALEAAVEALHTLKQSDISTLKTLKSPPSGIKLVMEAVCILLGEKPTKIPDPEGLGKRVYEYWPTAHKVLSDMKFLNRLRKIDKDKIPDDVMETIRSKRFVGNPEFDPDKVRQASLAAEGMCLWVRALEVYNRVVKVVRPKRQKLKMSEKEVKEQMLVLRSKRKDLHTVTERLQVLNDEFGKMRQKKKDLEQQIRNCEIKTDRARRLLAGLGDEGERWKMLTEELTAKCERFIGDVFLASVFIAYLSRYDLRFRERTIEEIRLKMETLGIDVAPGPFHLNLVFDDLIRIHHWHTAGLPEDTLSVDNALIVYHSRRWPLILDPQGEAKKWLEKVEGNRLIMVKERDSDLMTSLENAITMGLPILIESSGEGLDSRLSPLWELNIYQQANKKFVRLGGKALEYNDTFRLFLVKKTDNTNLPTTVLDKVCMVDFVLTPQGVEDEVLDLFLNMEAPQLQERREKLLVENSENRDGLSQLETQILKLLTSTRGSVLEDEGAIEVLSQAKKLADDILRKQREAGVAEKEIEGLREEYRPVAQLASTLFFTLQSMRRVNFFYQFSLSWFLKLFTEAVTDFNKTYGKEHNSLGEKIAGISRSLRVEIYKRACISLFHKDTLVFALHLALIKQKQTTFNPASRPTSAHNGTSRRFSMFPQAHGKGIVDMILMKKEKNIVGEAEKYVSTHLGKEFMEQLGFDLDNAFATSTPRVPLLLLLTPGHDPLSQLMVFAKGKGVSQERLRISSLGKGVSVTGKEEETVVTQLKRAAAEGWWLIIQNCHLASPASFYTLQHICEDILRKQKDIHKDFRLWLTAYPLPNFPVSLLQLSTKITTEPPIGIRASLMKAYRSKLTQSLETGPLKEYCYRLCCFYAVVKERGRYGVVGWRGKEYNFQETDLTTSIAHLESFSAKVNEMHPAELRTALRQLVVEATYGGRISIEEDSKIISALFDFMFQSESDPKFPKSLFPSDFEKPKILEHIDSMGQGPMPELCGLHKNARLFLDRQRSTEFLNSVRNVVGVSGIMGEGQEVGVEGGSSLKELKLKLEKARKHLHKESVANPILDVLADEISVLLKQIDMVIHNVDRKDTPTDILSNIFVNRSESPMPHRTSQHLIKEILWRAPSLLETEEGLREGRGMSLDINAVSRPRRLVRAVLHREGRRLGMEVQQLQLHSQLLNPLTHHSAKTDGILIKGLHLVNGSFGREEWALKEMEGKDLHDTLPPVVVTATKETGGGEEEFPCPVFTSLHSSDNQDNSASPIFTLQLPSPKPPSHWILRGVVAVCQSPDF